MASVKPQRLSQLDKYNYHNKNTDWQAMKQGLLGAIELARIAYWAPKEQQKGLPRGSKSENQLNLRNFESVRPKYRQLFRTNWHDS